MLVHDESVRIFRMNLGGTAEVLLLSYTNTIGREFFISQVSGHT